MDVIKFSQNKALECSRDNNLLDRDSARLLWDFIMLLCRQNGVRLCKHKQEYVSHKLFTKRLCNHVAVEAILYGTTMWNFRGHTGVHNQRNNNTAALASSATFHIHVNQSLMIPVLWRIISLCSCRALCCLPNLQ